MSVQVARIVSAVVLLSGTFLCGICPSLIAWIIRKQRTKNGNGTSNTNWIARKSDRVISFLMCIGAGILFSTCFIHLLPDIREIFDDLDKKSGKNDTENDSDETLDEGSHQEGFPWPEFITCVGFLFIYLFEEVLKLIFHQFNVNSVEQPKPSSGFSYQDLTRNLKEENDDLLTTTKTMPVYGATDQTNYKHAPHYHNASTSTGNKIEECHEGHIHQFKSGLSLRGMLIVAAFSFHSLFEGFSIGLQNTENKTWTMLFAIAVHKFIIAVVIGIEAVEEETPLKVVVVYMTIFSLMSPVGIVSAIIANSKSLIEKSKLISGIFNGVATGTLLYVTFFEILNKEKDSKLPGMLQLIGLFIGFSFMTAVDTLSAQFGE